MAATTTVARPIKTVAQIFLARLLDPSDFGLVALALLVVSITDLFSELGMGSAVIQSRLPKEKIAFPAFLLNLIFSAVLFLAVYLNAAFLASLLGEPKVTPVLRWLSFLILLSTLALIPDALLRKEMMFNMVGRANLAAVLAYNGVAVALAFLGFGLWSLVYAELAREIAKILVLGIACRGWGWLKPKRWERETLRGLLRFGSQSMGSGFVAYLNTNWDDWLVGRVLGSTALGFYSKAYNFTNQAIVQFNRSVISGVFFPSYAKMQADPERLRRAYLKSLGLSALVMSALSMGAFAVAPEMVPIVFGAKWAPMIFALQSFAFMGLLRPLSGSTSPVFLAVGRPDLNLRAGLVQLGVMVPLVLLSLSRGIDGVALAVTAAFGVGFVYNVFQMHRLIPGAGPQMLRAIAPALLASAAMVAGVYLSKPALRQMVGGEHNWLSLAAMVAIGAAIYLVAAFLLRRALILEAFSLLLAAVRGRKRHGLRRVQAEE